MGEVYRARDTRLDRDVAIKILPEAFVNDPDRLSRFEREAKTLASLNHTNIAQIHGTEVSGSIHALVMEFVDGEDLAQRLSRGPLPIDEALQIARQVAEALEAAHERGIVHRDLKPANIKVRPDGAAKVLDFGLAKAIDTTPVGPPFRAGVSGLADSPTFTSPAVTQMGVILGTAPYMSPEQAKGKPVDRGSDMWSFGALLFEMLSGKVAFGGETVTDVLAAIVTRDPDWALLPAATPPAIVRLLRRCLERDRRRRLADAGEARFQIEEALTAGSSAYAENTAGRENPALRTAPPRATRWSWIPWAIIAAMAIAMVALAVRTRPGPAPDVERFNLEVPPKAALSLLGRPAVAISPDGKTLIFTAAIDGIDRLYVRRTGSFESTPIPGTEGATHPVISPDGRLLAFMTSTRLATMPLAGGPIVTLADVGEPRGLSWDDNDSILYSPAPAGGVFRVPVTGGAPVAVSTPVAGQERTHRWPQSLPGGAVMFTAGSLTSPDSYDEAVIAAVMPDGARRTVLAGAAMARYIPTGHLLFLRGSTLFAVRFDPQRAEVKGTSAAVLADVAGDSTTGAGHFAVSPSGTVLYVSAGNSRGSLLPTWVDRAGAHDALPLAAGTYADLRISPDDQQVAFSVVAGGGREIWIHHFQRRTMTRVTYGGQSITPLWSRDGATVYYSTVDPTGANSTIFRRPSDGSRDAEPLVTLPGRVYLNDLIADERRMIFDRVRPPGIEQVELVKGATPVLLVGGRGGVKLSRLSPDGRWLAYVSDESGRAEVFVRALAEGGGRWQVSTGGGEEPNWSSDGRTLYYRYGTTLFGAAVTPGKSTFEWSTPKQVLTGIHDLRSETGMSYDVFRQGERFLMIRPPIETAAPQSLRVIVNWTRELK